MVKLADDQLDAGYAAIQRHGYGAFFPLPPEWSAVTKNWANYRKHLSGIDLDIYRIHEPLTTFAPKSRLNIRSVTLLHPFDLIIYTSLVMALRDDIGAARLSEKTRRVFSYRTERAPSDALFTAEPTFKDFRNRIKEKVNSNPNNFVAATDIADFYPSIYQHRLINSIDAAASRAKPDLVRVLEKLLLQFSGNTSYGVPVGPFASQILGEAVLIDVDAALRAERIDFIRYVDDYVIFSRTPEEAEAALYYLAETLYRNHGHTLQSTKTVVLKASTYLEKFHVSHDDRAITRREILRLLMTDGPYEIKPYDQLSQAQRDKLDAFNLSQMLQEALEPGKVVDYDEVNFILGKLSALRKPELIPLVLDNIERLYPVAGSVASFFSRLNDLPPAKHKNVAGVLLRPLLKKHGVKPPVYYSMWILHLFHNNSMWNHAESLVQVFTSSPSPVVRRYAALALASSGTRAQAVQLKEHFRAAPSMVRTALLLASHKLGGDERKFWRNSLGLTDPLERDL